MKEMNGMDEKVFSALQTNKRTDGKDEMENFNIFKDHVTFTNETWMHGWRVENCIHLQWSQVLELVWCYDAFERIVTTVVMAKKQLTGLWWEQIFPASTFWYYPWSRCCK